MRVGALISHRRQPIGHRNQSASAARAEVSSARGAVLGNNGGDPMSSIPTRRTDRVKASLWASPLGAFAAGAVMGGFAVEPSARREYPRHRDRSNHGAGLQPPIHSSEGTTLMASRSSLNT